MNWFRTHPRTLNLLLFLLVVFLAFAMRTWHYNTSVEILRDEMNGRSAPELNHSFLRKFFPVHYSHFIPFTIESAMMFAYAQDIADGKGVPARDARLAGQEDLAPYQQMNMCLEWFLGWGWRIRNAVLPSAPPEKDEQIFEDNPAMGQWMSAQLRLWASLSTGFLFCWLLAMKCSRPMALFGALLHAVSLAAIARSTGQDIVRGEFCIPLYTACLALAYSAYSAPKIRSLLLLFLCAFFAFVSWDLSQMLFGIWALCELFRFLLGRRVEKGRVAVWAVIAAAVLLNAAFVPFNQTYGLIRSSLVWVALPSLGIAFLCARWKLLARFRRPLYRWGIVLAVPMFLYFGWNSTVNTPEYRSNYSHFSEAMAAKLKFRNVKPRNPVYLSYEARILWTPSMHSCTWDIAGTFFPTLLIGKSMNFVLFRFLFGYLPVTLGLFYILLVVSLLFRMTRTTLLKSFPDIMLPILFTVGFTFAFAFIVRYHEFLILFLSAALPLLVRNALRSFREAPARVVPGEFYTALYRKRGFLRTVRGTLLVLCVLVLAVETIASLAGRRRYTGDVPFADTARVIAWFRSAGDTMKGKAVAANITVGPMLMAYTGTGITMNPQFGLKRIRVATREFIESLFAKDETALLNYCEKYHADYVLYNVGVLNDQSDCGFRYLANVEKVEERSPANLMYYRPDLLRWFCRIEPPPALDTLTKTYRLFKVIHPADRKKAASLTLDAMTEERRENFEASDRLLKEALLLDPLLGMAREVYLDRHGKFPEITLYGLEEEEDPLP